MTDVTLYHRAAQTSCRLEPLTAVRAVSGLVRAQRLRTGYQVPEQVSGIKRL